MHQSDPPSAESTKSEIRNPKHIRNRKPEIQNGQGSWSAICLGFRAFRPLRGWIIVAWVVWWGTLYGKMVVEQRRAKLQAWVAQVTRSRSQGDAGRTTTRAAGTPGTPPSNWPRPPASISRQRAPAWIDMRPATSLIGANKGRPPRASVTVS